MNSRKVRRIVGLVTMLVLIPVLIVAWFGFFGPLTYMSITNEEKLSASESNRRSYERLKAYLYSEAGQLIVPDTKVINWHLGLPAQHQYSVNPCLFVICIGAPFNLYTYSTYGDLVNNRDERIHYSLRVYPLSVSNYDIFSNEYGRSAFTYNDYTWTDSIIKIDGADVKTIMNERQLITSDQNSKYAKACISERHAGYKCIYVSDILFDYKGYKYLVVLDTHDIGTFNWRSWQINSDTIPQILESLDIYLGDLP